LKIFDNGKDITLNNYFGGYASLCEELFDYNRNLLDKKQTCQNFGFDVV
jgi:hypothetical protein